MSKGALQRECGKKPTFSCHHYPPRGSIVCNQTLRTSSCMNGSKTFSLMTDPEMRFYKLRPYDKTGILVVLISCCWRRRSRRKVYQGAEKHLEDSDKSLDHGSHHPLWNPMAARERGRCLGGLSERHGGETCLSVPPSPSTDQRRLAFQPVRHMHVCLLLVFYEHCFACLMTPCT